MRQEWRQKPDLERGGGGTTYPLILLPIIYLNVLKKIIDFISFSGFRVTEK